MKINPALFEPEEYVVGTLFGFFLVGFLGAWVLLSVPICALLWRLGGMNGGDKLFRRLGVPSVLCGLLVITGNLSWITALLCVVASFGILSMGYGIPQKK